MKIFVNMVVTKIYGGINMLEIVKKNKSSLTLRHTDRNHDEYDLVVKVGDAEKKFIVDNFDHIVYDKAYGILKFIENKETNSKTTLARKLYKKLVSNKKVPKTITTKDPMDMRVSSFNA
jgi:hypothetical protein